MPPSACPIKVVVDDKKIQSNAFPIKLSIEPSPEPTATPEPTSTPTPTLVANSTPATTLTGTIRVYVQWDGPDFEALTKGDCDYSNPNRRVPPCRGGLADYSFPIYNSSTKEVIQSPPTDLNGWVTVSLPPGSYYLFRDYKGGEAYLPDRHKTPFVIETGKQTPYLMIVVEP